MNISVQFGSRSYDTAFSVNAPSVARSSPLEDLRAASAALADAFHSFKKEVTPIYSRSTVKASSVVALLTGAAASAASASQSSSSAIGLNVTSAASTIQSTADMVDTTSYGSSTLNFSGSGLGSTSVATLSGTYTGVGAAADATSLVVEINSAASPNTLLATNVRFEVQDQEGNVLFTHNGSIKAGEQVYLGDDIGLYISFSSGSLTQNHTASTTVSHYSQITAGSFKINGTSIAVNAGEAISTLVSRINASAAGVTASFANDRITMTSSSASEDDIVLSNDTSGFLSAANLTAATTTHGNIRDDQQALSGTSAFSSVTDGSFTINGTSISIDADTDTLETVISRINASDAGVTASYNSSTDKLVLTSGTSGAALSIGNDSSGFLAAANIDAAGFDASLTDVAAYSGVQSGTITVNGNQISIDPDTMTIRDVVSQLNDVDDVVATLDETSGRIRLMSELSGGTLVISDTSDLLSALGIATGTYEGSRGVEQITQTQTGSTTVTNAQSVVDDVAAAVNKLNEVFLRLNPEVRGKLKAALQDAIDLLGEKGVTGLSLPPSAPGLMSLSLDRTDVAGSLVGNVGALKGILDEFSSAVATFTETSKPEQLSREMALFQLNQLLVRAYRDSTDQTTVKNQNKLSIRW